MKIFIDPGHGGDDTGADGPTGLHEKDVVLDISRTLGELLRNDGYMVNHSYLGYETYTELYQRCDMANDWGANYFISIHLNSNGPEARGIETLIRDKGSRAERLAILVQTEMVRATGDWNRGIKYRTDLAVLNGTEMPALLVECGFISHPETEGRFRTEEYTKLLAEALYKGIRDFCQP